MKWIIVLFGFVFAMLNYISYQVGYQDGTKSIDMLYFKNNQTEVLFNSEYHSCEIENKVCGIGVTQLMGNTYFFIDKKAVTDNSVKNYLNKEI